MDTTTCPRFKKLVVLLVKPTTYDDRGYPLRFRRGVLPSNSLAAMYSLTREVVNDASLGVEKAEVHVFDDAVWNQRVTDPETIVRAHADEDTCVVVGLVGVQTNQFPRAVHLAEQFKAAGASVVMGGFHVRSPCDAKLGSPFGRERLFVGRLYPTPI